jgi:sugar/nucleoside kinase (ribokinase family)
VLTSLDGGGLRSNTHDLLGFIDVAIVAERLCEQMRLSPGEMLDYLRGRGCRIGGVTVGEYGLVWYGESGETHVLPALRVPPERVIDTNGAGDIFHGAYIFSYLTTSGASWDSHFRFARAASAHSIQHLGNEASLPTLASVNETHAMLPEGPRRSIARLLGGQERSDSAWAKKAREAAAG